MADKTLPITGTAVEQFEKVYDIEIEKTEGWVWYVRKT